MTNRKHLGRILSTGRKCLIAYRTIPNDAFNCLIIQTELLDPAYHDALINLVESNAGQSAYEFAEALARTMFPDGTNMLHTLHLRGQLTKMPTDAVEVLPNNLTSILLSDLNQMIAEQQGVSVQDLALKASEQKSEVKDIASVKDLPADTVEDLGKTSSASVNQTNESVVISEKEMTVEDKARSFRSQADKLSKQAAELRRLAEELVPTKKRIAVKE